VTVTVIDYPLRAYLPDYAARRYLSDCIVTSTTSANITLSPVARPTHYTGLIMEHFGSLWCRR